MRKKWDRVVFYGTLPVTFILTVPLHIAFSSYQYNNAIMLSINRIFVNYGYPIFTALYAAFLYQDLSHYKRYIKIYGAISALTIAVFFWFFGPLIFDRIDILAGGHCSLEYYTVYQCEWHQGTWYYGFDSSGHYFILLIFILTITNELIQERDRRHERIKLSLLTVLSGFTVLVWYTMFLVTSIFFHTFKEKVVGLTAAYIIPVFVL
jgi:hypothetical protein